MRLFLSRVLHIMLAFAVLVSSAGFVVDKHYCGGKLKSFAIYVRAKGCANEEHASCAKGGHCNAHKKQEKKKCCHDTVEFHKLSQDQKITEALGFSLNQPGSFTAIIPAAPSFICAIPETLSLGFLRYKPPPRYCEDIHSLLQVFRL